MAHLTKEHIQHLHETFGELRVLDDIISYRAADDPPVPILGYPKTADGVNNYEYFTGQQLDWFINGAVDYFIESGFKPATRKVIGILAPSDVDFVVTFFALSRLGYTVLCLSLRLPPIAIVNLLRRTNCTTVAHGHDRQIAANIASINQGQTIRLVAVPTRASYGNWSLSNKVSYLGQFDYEKESDEICLIMHSSGSTGLPKPVFLTHKNVLTHPVQGAGMHNFGTLPLYHMYGLSTTLQAMYMRKTASLFSATQPLTADNIVSAIEATHPEVFHAVPYALNLLVEHPRGLAALKSAKIVTAAGARTPDELGDRLVKENINFGVVFGTTEAGLLGDTMRRKKDDNSWNYVRIYSNIRTSIYMDPIGNEQYEAIYLRSHPGLSTSNSDSPAPGSWRSKDVFTPHPTIPDIWKYVTRLDDRVTLSNGEKVLPLPIEGRIRQDKLVREAVVVGVDRAIPGVLIFKASDRLADNAFLDAVWPSIEDANSRAEAFSQITKEMVTMMPSDVEYPKTDKGSIIRAQVYEKFSEEIEKMYTRLERYQEGTLQLDLEGIEEFLKATYQDVLGAPLEHLDSDFFTAGIDSLKAIQMRRIIQRTLNLGGKQLSSNIVYECGNAKILAKYLFSLGQHLEDTGEESGENADEVSAMEKLIQKYSNFGQSAILTGATGSLGAHTLAQMVRSHRIIKVYCLVRGPDPLGRIMKSIKDRGIELDGSSQRKITALSADVTQNDLGLGNEMIEHLKRNVSLIVHLAWPVNFNIALPSLEPQLAGLRNLLTLSLAVYRQEPARLFFASSISAAENTPAPAVIPEAPINNLDNALPMGYAQSKLVGEHMVLHAARNGARSYVLRIGQIVGDKQNGNWNDHEFIPSMIRSALSMKALPALHDDCSWLPVDIVATAILELDRTLESGPKPCAIDPADPPVIYNVVNPHVFSWDQLLKELRKAGLEFQTVPFSDWLQRLRNSASHCHEELNPATKLIGHFEQRYSTGRTINTDGPGRASVTFDTKYLQRDSAILRQPPDIIKDGYVNTFVSRWLQKWAP
ncbi:acetyl-CoA synthetase-like protein [Xylariaceae sp. FL0662B]|nr:acetyl-CoA synthetase-like protein [Xylariaceae sp. FL0662B]